MVIAGMKSLLFKVVVFTKQTQIMMPERFVAAVALLMHSLEDYNLTAEDRKLCDEINGLIGAKLEAMKRRELYTQSKTAATTDEKEKARQAYLDEAGIHKDFRW